MVRFYALLALSLGVFGSAAFTSPAIASTANCPDAGLEYVPGKNLESRVRASVFCITNVERTGHGLPALTTNAQLEVAAQWHSSDMARLRFYSHYAPAAAGHGVSFSDRADRAGYKAVPGWPHPVLAENIYQSPTTPYEVVSGFMKSIGHCQNILNEMVSEIGIGVAYGQSTKSANSHPFWTQLFGSRDPNATPKWQVNPGFNGCPHTKMRHPKPEAPNQPDSTPSAPKGTAQIVTVNGQKRVSVSGSAPGLKSVRVTPVLVRTVRGRTVSKPGPSLVVRVNPTTAKYQAVVRTPPPGKGRPFIRVSNNKAKVSTRIPIRRR